MIIGWLDTLPTPSPSCIYSCFNAFIYITRIRKRRMALSTRHVNLDEDSLFSPTETSSESKLVFDDNKKVPSTTNPCYEVTYDRADGSPIPHHYEPIPFDSTYSIAKPPKSKTMDTSGGNDYEYMASAQGNIYETIGTEEQDK